MLWSRRSRWRRVGGLWRWSREFKFESEQIVGSGYESTITVECRVALFEFMEGKADGSTVRHSGAIVEAAQDV